MLTTHIWLIAPGGGGRQALKEYTKKYTSQSLKPAFRRANKRTNGGVEKIRKKYSGVNIATATRAGLTKDQQKLRKELAVSIFNN